MDVDGYQMPDDLYYQKGFMWARVTGNVARVGLIDYAQKLAGEISYAELPFVGDVVVQGAEVGTVETGKWVGKLYAPMSGKIITVNEKLNDDPTIMNKDPYGVGWAFEIEIKDPSETGKLMKVAAAIEWIKEEAKKR
jgi:glycine cleavage system H protein